MNLLVLVLMLISSPATAAHPIHIAISEIHYAKESRSLQVMHKIFMDDLEDHIKQLENHRGNQIQLYLGSKKEHPDADAYLERYARSHFMIKADGKELKGKYLGKEYETDAVWIYIEIENIPHPKQLEIASLFLLDFYNDQTNYVYLNIGGQKKSLRFHGGERRQTVSF